MLLKDEMAKDGDFLFRYRSYIPLVMIPLLILSLLSFDQELFSISKNGSVDYNTPLVIVALVVGCVGQWIRILVAGYVPQGTSGRNVHGQVANSLNTTGMYSLCRNPLYLGNFLMMIAPMILLGNWLLLLAFCALFWIYYERIIYTEERFLEGKFGEEYTKWAESTPAFFPSFKNYKKSVLEFSLKTMLKREYHSFFGLTTSLLVANYLIVSISQEDWTITIDPILLWVFIASAVFYLIIRFIVKKTRYFHVEGR